MLADKLRAATAAAVALPEFVSSSVGRGSGSATVNVPAGTQDGDLLIALAFSVAGSHTSVGWPSAFTGIHFDAPADNGFYIATRIASGEPANYNFGFQLTGSATFVLLTYRNATRVNTVGTMARASSTTVGTASSIFPTYDGVLCAAFYNESPGVVSGVSAPSGMALRASFGAGGPGSTPQALVYDQSQVATATGTRSVTWATSGVVASILFQITNEPTVAPEFVASASTQNTSTSSTLTINKPIGTVEGDLMVAVVTADSGISWTGDTSWTEVADQGTTPSLRIAYKVAGASEGSSYTFIGSSSKILSGCILTYRYAAYDTIGSFATGTNPLILPSISPSESQSILIAAGARSGSYITLGTPTDMTARVTDNDATVPSYIVCDQIVAKGPTGTRSMSTGSTSSVAGIMLSIKPTRSL